MRKAHGEAACVALLAVGGIRSRRLRTYALQAMGLPFLSSGKCECFCSDECYVAARRTASLEGSITDDFLRGEAPVLFSETCDVRERVELLLDVALRRNSELRCRLSANRNRARNGGKSALMAVDQVALGAMLSRLANTDAITLLVASQGRGGRPSVLSQQATRPTSEVRAISVDWKWRERVALTFPRRSPLSSTSIRELSANVGACDAHIISSVRSGRGAKVAQSIRTRNTR